MTNNLEFTKSHTQLAKGVAIVLMMIRHLFAFPERIQNVSYISMISFGNFGLYQNWSLEFFLGDFGNICVAMYLFLSGYGLCISSLRKDKFTIKDSIKKMMKFLINYWVVFIIFVPIGLIWFRGNTGYHLSIVEFMANFFTLSSSYNMEWWFVRLYIELLLLFPFIKSILKGSVISSVATSLGVYFLSIVVEVIVIKTPQMSFLKTNFFYKDVMEILFWQMTFCTGFIIAKFNLFNYINEKLTSKRLDKNSIYALTIIAIIVVRIEFSSICKIIGKGNATYIDFILVPTFILVCTNLIQRFKSKNVFLVLGKHSTNIWLTHTFFCFYYFQRVIFLPKLSILILVWLSALSLGASTLINFILKKLQFKFRGGINATTTKRVNS
ncbi:acyltransferase family protein [Clostridium lacusfryxellense]|uniref:acyltransferase family protein n=1 Tax=Clostridium lacusfryxellense TaxID=205328 RepID=UPI0028A8A111|nr:acyltransferase [Clostridium lacusfryxellense]